MSLTSIASHDSLLWPDAMLPVVQGVVAAASLRCPDSAKAAAAVEAATATRSACVRHTRCRYFSCMLEPQEEENHGSEAEAIRRRRIRRLRALGTTAAIGLGAAGLTLLVRHGVGLSHSRNSLEHQHFVREHTRKLQSGRVVPVRAHLRGPRDAAIETTALIQPDRLHLVPGIGEGVQLDVPAQFLAAA